MSRPMSRNRDLGGDPGGDPGGSHATSVYFIRCELTGAIKIGISSDPMRRLRQLQTANPGQLTMLFTMPGDATTEKALHSRFAAKGMAHESEWFQLSDEDIEAILRGDFEDISPTDHKPERLLRSGDRVRLTKANIFGWRGTGTVILDQHPSFDVITMTPDGQPDGRVQAKRGDLILLRSWSLPKPKSSIGA